MFIEVQRINPIKPSYKFAFSLVELSIVLVVLGLLVGAVVTGRSLLRAAELRSAVTEFQQWQSAVNTFRDEYGGLPGDINDATDYWGAAVAGGSCATTAGSGTQTCNGNGNGTIDPSAAVSQYAEWFTFWQHLANAQLIENVFTGRNGSASTTHFTVANSPPSRIAKALWMVANDASSGAALFPVAVVRHNYRLGGETSTSWPSAALFTLEEIWSIDKKIDDGLPGLGNVTSYKNSYAANCTTTSDAVTSEYKVTHKSKACIIFFATGF